MAGFFVVFFSQRQEIIITYSCAPNEVSHVETKIAWDFGIQSRDFCVKMRGWTGNQETRKRPKRGDTETTKYRIKQ